LRSPSPGSPSLWKRARVLAGAVVLVVSSLEAASLYRFYLGHPRLPLWDMAGHGWGGVELLRALADGHPFRFLNLLNRQDKWPFGYSLLLLPFLAAGGASFAAATLLSTVTFALIPVLLVWAAREVDDGAAGLWGGLFAAALFLQSPLLRVFGILVMRELAGIAFSLLAFVLYLRARRLGTPWAWRLAGLALLALFLVKYNYALVWVLAVLANEIWRLPPARRRELARRAARVLRPWGQTGWGRTALAVYLDLLILATLLGINPGVGIYAGLVAGAAWLALRWRRNREALEAQWHSLPLEVRTALATVVIPLWAWCLSPDPIHPKNIIAFLRNRSAGPSFLSAESWTFYPRSLARDYAAVPLLGTLVLALFLVSLLRVRTAGEPFRVLVLTASLGLGLATFHPYKELRFLAVTAPFLMLAATLTLSHAAHGRGEARPLRLVLGGLVMAGLLIGTGALALSAGGPDLDARLAADYKLYSGRMGFWRALQFLGDHSVGARRVGTVGTFNELSDDLFRWWLALDEKTRGITVVDPPSRPDPGLPPPAARARLHRWLERQRPDRILAIRLLPASRFFQGEDFQAYNAWQLAAIADLETDSGWRVTRRKVFAGLAMEVVVLDQRTPAPALSP
jgi:hypothetical protein